MDIGSIINGLGGLVKLFASPPFMAWWCGILAAIGTTQLFKKAPFLRPLGTEREREARRWYLRGISSLVGWIVGGLLWEPFLFAGWRTHIESPVIGAAIGLASFMSYDIYKLGERWLKRKAGEPPTPDNEETRLL